MRPRLHVALTAAMLFTSPALAAQSSITIELGLTGDFDRRTLRYDCANDATISVSYINAAPNFLALVPIEDEVEPHVFTAVIAASGARYASGKWVWWTKGAEASLYDVTLGEEAEPMLTCTEINDTP